MAIALPEKGSDTASVSDDREELSGTSKDVALHQKSIKGDDAEFCRVTEEKALDETSPPWNDENNSDSESCKRKTAFGKDLSGRKISYRAFKLLQEWEGIVIECCEDEGTVHAELHDLTARIPVTECVELPIGEIPEADLDLIRPGAVFYWVIGYEDTAGGQRRRVSEIRVRRFPTWSQSKIDSVKAKAQALRKSWNIDSENEAAKTG